MLDQSFSYENFRILLDVENRKGRYLEGETFFKPDIFEKSRDISDEIIEKNKEIREEIKKVKAIKKIEDRDYSTLDELNAEKDQIKEKRELALESILRTISNNTDVEDYQLKIEKGQVKWGSQLYEIEHSPENYFVSKQLQRNIFKTFKVKQANRKEIIDQLRILLDDGFPKIVIRTDIQKFYESIPHKELLAKIEENSLLSFPSKKIIRSVLNQYWKILVADGVKAANDERIGIPRGVGFSAYLSELYLRTFDNKIKSFENVTYYTRYVDDIIMIITPQNRNELKTILSYKNDIKKTLLDTSRLNLNLSKTQIIDLRKGNKERKKSFAYDLTYLGYKFRISYSKKKELKCGVERTYISKDKLQISMSDEKLNRYKEKVKTSFDDYILCLVKYSSAKNSTERMLFKRIKFLTNNHQLLRRKSNVFIGIYFSNEFLTTPLNDLKLLDEYLIEKISNLAITTNTLLVKKINGLSFSKGFMDKNIVQFNTESFKSGKIIEIWKNL
ncbi:MAG: RNA-directed DNA polymerase [Bacteroidales bacterium]|jgi:hypothetical protein|nr:RNA-directed DNA polymerase [Bacteroidales bacterium]